MRNPDLWRLLILDPDEWDNIAENSKTEPPSQVAYNTQVGKTGEMTMSLLTENSHSFHIYLIISEGFFFHFLYSTLVKTSFLIFDNFRVGNKSIKT